MTTCYKNLGNCREWGISYAFCRKQDMARPNWAQLSKITFTRDPRSVAGETL